MAEQLSYRHPNTSHPDDSREIGKANEAQVVFPANLNRKGGFICNQSNKSFQVHLGQSDVTPLAPGKAVQFGAETGEICVVGEYQQRFMAMEFYSP